jgi:DNA polymerase-3 subunit delta'
VLGLTHPDVHWFIPIPRPKAGDPDKQVEEAAEAIGDVIAERREQPLWTPPDGMAMHGLATARLVLRRLSLTSVEGGRRVVIIGDAERLVPQESSPEAANALLKVIEEPPRATVFLLTAADPSCLLPTIRSRAVLLRLGRLTDAEVRGFLETHRSPKPSPTVLASLVAMAQGSIGRALAEDQEAARAREGAEAVLEAVLAGSERALQRALSQPPWHARGEFTALLDAVASLLMDAARERAGVAPLRPVPEPLRRRSDAAGLLRAAELVQSAREEAQGNLNPQLLLATLSTDLEEALCA